MKRSVVISSDVLPLDPAGAGVKLKTARLYEEALRQKASRKGKEDLVELDRWYRGALRQAIQKREPEMFLTQPELVKLVQWKLTRGTWRPKLLGYAEEQKEEDVVSASTEAFKLAGQGDMKGALERLTQLKGVGPATASAVLAAGMADIPFMSDEILLDVNGEKEYTAAAFAQLVQKLKKKLDDGSTAEAYEQKVWAAKHAAADAPLKRSNNSEVGQSANKRSRKK